MFIVVKDESKTSQADYSSKAYSPIVLIKPIAERSNHHADNNSQQIVAKAKQVHNHVADSSSQQIVAKAKQVFNFTRFIPGGGFNFDDDFIGK